jgi:hypothetical protein
LGFAIVLAGAGAGFIAHHVRTWRRQRERIDLSDEDYRYFRSQYYRRTQASAMMIVLAVAIVIGTNVISVEWHPQLYVYFWCGTVVLVAWMALLAIGDLWLVRRYAARQRGELLRARREIDRKLRELAKSKGNGRGEES